MRTLGKLTVRPKGSVRPQDADEQRFGARLQVGDRYELPGTAGFVYEVTAVGPGSATVRGRSGTRTEVVKSKITGEVIAEFEKRIPAQYEGQVSRFSTGKVMLPREEQA